MRDIRELFLSTRLLHLILMPTEQCNLRCTYCYEDFLDGEMKRPVIEAIKAMISRRIGELDLLSLEWFGGEPLLALKVVEEIQVFVSDLGRQYPTVKLVGSMTTNGVLLDLRRFERLLTVGVRHFQISLDGDLEHHDLTRLRIGGGGTFGTIWKNILALRAARGSFEVLLRLHVTRDNRRSLNRLLEALSRELGGDRRFFVVFKAIRRFGGLEDEALAIIDSNDEEGALKSSFMLAAELGLQIQEGAFSQPGVLPGCYAAALGSYVVRSAGDLSKCTVALAHPNNRIGTLNRDGTVSIHPARMAGWVRGALNGEMESLECPMKGWADDAREDERYQLPLVQIGVNSKAQTVVPGPVG